MPTALAQLGDARQWWLEHRDRAPHAFDDDVDALIELLEEHPQLVGRPLLDDPRVRRVYLRRIRYYVYFQLSDDAEAVEIVAVWHGSRGTPPTI